MKRDWWGDCTAVKHPTISTFNIWWLSDLYTAACHRCGIYSLVLIASWGEITGRLLTSPSLLVQLIILTYCLIRIVDRPLVRASHQSTTSLRLVIVTAAHVKTSRYLVMARLCWEFRLSIIRIPVVQALIHRLLWRLGLNSDINIRLLTAKRTQVPVYIGHLMVEVGYLALGRDLIIFHTNYNFLHVLELPVLWCTVIYTVWLKELICLFYRPWCYWVSWE